MKFLIHGTAPDGYRDSLVIEGETLEEARQLARQETGKRAWRDCWSEELIDDSRWRPGDEFCEPREVINEAADIAAEGDALIAELNERLERSEGTVSRMEGALRECWDYFDERADADLHPDSATASGNEEMTMLVMIHCILEANGGAQK